MKLIGILIVGLSISHAALAGAYQDLLPGNVLPIEGAPAFTFEDIEKAEGSYAGYTSLGSKVYECKVIIRRVVSGDSRAVDVVIEGDLKLSGGAPVNETYLASDLVDYGLYSVFIKKHKWVTGDYLGGLFTFDRGGKLIEVSAQRIGPGGGACELLRPI